MAAQKDDIVLVKLIFRGLIPLAMLVVGGMLMTSTVTGWNVIIGTPIVVSGMVILLFTYDEVVRGKVRPHAAELGRCNVCGRLAPRQPGVNPEDIICRHCRREIGVKLQGGRLAGI
jgi:hypothetical protein